MNNQLIQRYMMPAKARRGICLVYWTEPDQRNEGPRDRAELARTLTDQAATASDLGLEIRPYLLDISYPMT